jgi:uncharacterized FAD-dependent dehydrogenase
MVTLETRDFPSRDVFAGIHLQQEYEARAFAAGRGQYLCPIQLASDFLADRPTEGKVVTSYARGVVPTRLAELIPQQATRALHQGLPIMDRRWHGRFLADAILAGPEARGSSPVRILRDRGSRQSPGIWGLYPVGEGAGYAGGIVSAAVDGLHTAMAIIARYRPLVAR